MRAVALAALLVTYCWTPSAAEVMTYRVDYLGAGWTATGMNEHGDVCGSVSTDGTSLFAGVSKNGQPFQFLPLPAGMQTSRAHDINDAGVIVGSVCPNQYVVTQPIAAVWRPTPSGYDVEVLGGLPGDLYSAAYAVNNRGDILGASGYWGWNLSTGVLFTADGPVALPGGVRGSDINDQREVLVGSSILDLDLGELTEISLPAGNWQGVVSSALNENGDFCGYILGWSGCSTFPIRYRHGVGWEFLGGCATTTSATAINARGDALTYYYMTTSGAHFVDEGYFALGNLIDPSEGVWYVQYGGANAINDARQIVAAAREGQNGLIGAVRLTPLLPPAPGRVPNGSEIPGDPLTIAKLAGGALELTWDVAGCADASTDYEIYVGTIGDFTSHVPLRCTTDGATSAEIQPGGGDEYYLVVARNDTVEGSYGLRTGASPRPASRSSCLPQSQPACP